VPILHEHIEGKYEILGKLREGGMGAVYRVRHRLLDEVRVVKVLNPRLDVTPELSDRFLREARFAIQLRHPNIAHLHDFSIADDGSAFIVMEFIDGATLEDIVARTGPPPLGLGLEMARQSLKALGFLHRRGLIHRDISPDNLMLTRDADGEPLVKLIDLGIAKVLKGGAGGLTSTGMFLGKPRYASPEQFSAAGLAGVDARADLYSFGIVLYELLAGVCPIQGRDLSSLMAGHLFRPPLDFAESDPRGRLPSDLRAILLRTLAKVPDERFASAEDLARALGEVQDRFPVRTGELEAVLLAAAVPAPPSLPPGSTQGKLDQQFAAMPTPAPGQRTGPSPDATLVLSPQARPAVREETVPVPREPTPPPVVPPVVPIPPPVAAAPPAIPRVETPRPAPPERSTPPERRRRSLLPLAVILFVALAAAGFGLWWMGSRRPAPSPAAVSADRSAALAPAAPAAPTANLSPPPQKPETSESAPAVSAAGGAAQATPPAPEPPPAVAPQPQPPPPPRPAVTKKRPVIPESPSAPAPARERPKPSPKPEEPARPKQAPQGAPALTLGAKDLIDDAGEDVGAQLLSMPSPEFPEVARGTGTYGRILVAVRIDESGNVTETRIKTAYVEEGVASSGTGPDPPTHASLSAAFREAAQQAARKARFEPAQKRGKPVASWGELNVEFGKKRGG